MGIEQQITVSCDYKDCRVDKSGRFMVQYNPDRVNQGLDPQPEGVSDGIILTINSRQFFFCSKLHASLFFLPPGYECKQKRIVEFPVAPTPTEPNPENGQPGTEGA